ncbi:glycosyltransferase family 4 protein [Pedobacter lithocola]|uniref:Glycosyltransferase family 4 protein n=1 Tax=Pedobacter lithocola TaxID=1908239 RepID=A0ABV8P3P8_9SPHI
MKILIVTQYFWPESFRINDIALALVERGHEVEILTGKPNYPQGKFYKNYSFLSKSTEFWNDIKIHRVNLISRGKSGGLRLMMNYLSFAIFASFKAFFIKGNFDKILVYEPSPITVGIPAIIYKFRKKTPIYFWVQDLWPQSVTAAGGIKNKTILNALENLTRWIYKNSNKILIQSEAFRNILLVQKVNNNKIIYYPNSVEDFFVVQDPSPEVLITLPKGFKIMFAGNIGESQDFDTIMEAAKIVSKVNKEIKWIILGDGRKKTFVEEKIKQYNLMDNVILLGSHPVNSMPGFFSCADCLLVSLKKDYIFSLTIPSKIQSYLACGKPILASLDGEGGRVVKEAKAGLVSEAENPQLLAGKALAMAKLNPQELREMGKNSRIYFDANFERELLIDKLEYILNYE